MSYLNPSRGVEMTALGLRHAPGVVNFVANLTARVARPIKGVLSHKPYQAGETRANAIAYNYACFHTIESLQTEVAEGRLTPDEGIFYRGVIDGSAGYFYGNIYALRVWLGFFRSLTISEEALSMVTFADSPLISEYGAANILRFMIAAKNVDDRLQGKPVRSPSNPAVITEIGCNQQGELNYFKGYDPKFPDSFFFRGIKGATW